MKKYSKTWLRILLTCLFPSPFFSSLRKCILSIIYYDINVPSILFSIWTLCMYVFVQKPGFYHRTGPNSSQPSRRIISEALVKVDLKLLFIPLVFIFLRSWGTIRYFISWMADCYTYNETVEGNVCVSDRCFEVLYSPFLLGMQVILRI